MYYAKDYRDWARRALGESWLGGRWCTFVVIVLLYAVIVGVFGSFSFNFYLQTVASVGSFLIAGPLELSLSIVSLNAVRGFELKIETIIEGFHDFVRALVLYLLIGIFVFLWSLLFVIPGIVMSYAYSMSYFIMRDNPNMSANEARKLSIEIMRGNKWRLFCLQFSFIGWFILSMFTLGILLLWVVPYYRTAMACFYTSLTQCN